MKNKAKIIFFIFFIISFIGCSPKEKYKNETRFFMNTYVRITVPYATSNAVIEKCFAEIGRLEELVKNCPNEISRKDELFGLVKEALYVAEITDGAFDPTVLPAARLWKEAIEKKSLPDINKVKKAVSITGWRKIKKSGGKFIIPDNMKLDFGGIGKGWIVDKTAAYLINNNINEGIIDAGGDIKVWGNREWAVGIKNPYKEGVIAVLKCKNQAIATSGDYENYFILEGRKYHHLIDPATGFPADKLNSATVVSRKCSLADGLATGLFVLGPDKGKILEKYTSGIVLLSEHGRFSSDKLNIKWLQDE